jgi:hypothetical protein
MIFFGICMILALATGFVCGRFDRAHYSDAEKKLRRIENLGPINGGRYLLASDVYGILKGWNR